MLIKTSIYSNPVIRAGQAILETINASGTTLPPFLIFEGEYHQICWYPRNLPEGWKFGGTVDGWTSYALALRWLTKHFEPLSRLTSPSAKRLLLLDSHDSHKSWEFLHFSCANQMIVLCLHPHTAHKL
jgi:hypothetical protein